MGIPYSLRYTRNITNLMDPCSCCQQQIACCHRYTVQMDPYSCCRGHRYTVQMPEHHRQTTEPSVTQAFNVHVRHFMSYIVLQRHYHVLCLTTSIHPLPNRVRSSASSFIVFCRLVSLRSSSSCLCLLLCLPFSYIFLLSNAFQSAVCTQIVTVVFLLIVL